LSLSFKFNTIKPAQRTLDKPKQSNATIFISRAGWACFAILSVALACLKKHLNAVCQGRRIFCTFFILALDF